MAFQLKEKFEKPGSAGATNQWCTKMISKYPTLAGSGREMFQKTVIKFINKYILY